jgi:hypothetical protein
MTFSAWTAKAGEAQLRRHRLRALANEVLAETGGITQEEWDAAGDGMGLRTRKLRRRGPRRR